MGLKSPLRVASLFNTEGFFRYPPQTSHLKKIEKNIFPRIFIFLLEKKEAPQAPRNKKKYIFSIFFRFFFRKTTWQNFGNFEKFCFFSVFFFFYYTFYWKSVFSAQCLFGRIGRLKIFWEKKIGCRIPIFSHFLCQKTTLFSILGPPYFRAEGTKTIFGIFVIILPLRQKT